MSAARECDRKRILFVDDEPQALEALQSRLHRQRRKWDMVFVGGGEAALRELETSSFQVIVSDMKIPDIDGATLLKRVQQDYPGVVRIVLSGHGELERQLRALPVAHQFLTKPCDAELLDNVVERACGLQALIGDEAVRRTVGQIDHLPSLPRIYSALTRALMNPNVGARVVATILEQDMALCAKLLQVVNSSFFKSHQGITSVLAAVTYLGFNMVKNLVLSVEVFQAAKTHANLKGLSLDLLHRHALVTACIASRLLTDKNQSEDAFVAGILHDVGKLVMAIGMPEKLGGAIATAQSHGEPLHTVEQKLYGVTHAEVGAYLLALWGLPYPIVEAVANHHTPRRVAQPGFDLLGAVYVADCLAHQTIESTSGNGANSHSTLDVEYLASLGVDDQFAGWLEMAQEQAGSGEGIVASV